MSKIATVPCKVQKYSTEKISSNLLKVKIRVMHEDENYNGSNFSFDVIESAKESCKNIPILAYIRRDNTGEVLDFDEHNLITKIVETNEGMTVQEHYLEQPIGVIPETNNYHYEVVDGLRYVVVDGYIWKNYSNEAYTLLEDSETKGVSMEIEVQDGEFNRVTGNYDVNGYSYLGVTVLGDDVTPAMGQHTRLSKYSSKFNQIVEELNCEVKKVIESEVYSLEETKKVVEGTETEEIVETEVVEEVETTQEETATEETTETQEETATEETQEEEKIEETATEETQEEEKIEETEEEFKCKKKKKKYSSVEEVIVALNEVARVEELQFNEDNSCETVDLVIAKIAETFSVMQETINNLQAFKDGVDLEAHKVEVEEIVTEFAFSEEEVTEITEKAINKEITIENFKMQLYALEGRKAVEARKKFSSKKEEIAKVVITEKEVKSKPYGGLLG